MSTVTPALIEAALRDGYLIGEPVAKRRTNTAFVRATTGLLFTNGFSVNPDEAASLKKNSLEDAIAAAKKIVGEDRSWVPLFPDFPLHLDTNLELDIFLAQIRYYLTGERYDENASYRRGGETLSVKNLQKTLRPLEVMSAADYVRLVIGRMSGNETFSPKTVAALTAVVSDSALFDDLVGEFFRQLFAQDGHGHIGARHHDVLARFLATAQDAELVSFDVVDEHEAQGQQGRQLDLR